MDTGRMKKRISLLQLERYEQGELSPKEKVEFEKRYAHSAEFQELMEQRKARIERAAFNPLDEMLQTVVTGKEQRTSLWESLKELLYSIIRTPQVAFPLLAVIITIPLLLHKSDTVDPYAVKGRQFIELQCNRVSLPTLSVSEVLAGDTLSLRYRGVQPLFVQLWYRDDDGLFQPYLQSAEGTACSLGASTDLTTIPQKIILSDGWREETLILLADTNNFTVTADELGRGDSLPLLVCQEYTLELVERFE